MGYRTGATTQYRGARRERPRGLGRATCEKRIGGPAKKGQKSGSRVRAWMDKRPPPGIK